MSDAIKGFALEIRKSGTPVATTGQDAGPLSGDTYRINDPSRRIMDPSVAVEVYDNAVLVGSGDILSINPLLGTVTFEGAYTVTGPVTIDYTYIPSTVVGNPGTSFSVTEAKTEFDTTEFSPSLTYKNFTFGLKEVTLEITTLGPEYKTEFDTSAFYYLVVVFGGVASDNVDRMVARCQLTQTSTSVDVDGLVEYSYSSKVANQRSLEGYDASFTIG